MRHTTSTSVNNHEDGHYWISISDLMTSLLFIFIIILAYTIYSFTEKSDVFESSFNARGELLENLQKSLKEKDINVDIDPKNGNMRIKSDAFFAIGSADLNLQGQTVIVQIAHEIKSQMSNDKYKQAIDTIFIEGHTDDVPISMNYGRRWTNMELSAQRAINTYLAMDRGVNIRDMTNRDGRYLFSYSGYAESRPIDDNTTEVGRAKNRRIELFFALTSPQLGD